MAITKDAEKLVSQVENGEGAKYGRDARKFAVDSWKIHTGAFLLKNSSAKYMRGMKY